VPKEIKDLHLMDKLTLEADGILLWAIAGLKRLIEQDYQFSETERTIAETRRYKVKNNNVLAFVEEHCVIEPGAVASRKDMYTLYKEFCEEGGFGSPMSAGNFNDNVCKIDPVNITQSKENVTRRRIFKGIRLES